jgi:predicted methyltransferase
MLKSLATVLSLSLLGSTALADDNLLEVLGAQPDEVQQRYAARNSAATIRFFGIEPGMTVLEALPGNGWYSKILLPFLGSEGRLIGADYAVDMFPLFGFFGEDFINSKKTWVEDWPVEASEWVGAEGAAISAFQFGSMPEEMKGKADVAFVVRTLHNLARFEGQGGYLSKAVADLHAALKPGGVLGVVQHEARPDAPDEWASGAAGYLKESFVIELLENAGFVLEASSDMNNNPKDQPTTEDVVWRLPPTLFSSRDNPALKAQMMETSESHRMTLRFRKPE